MRLLFCHIPICVICLFSGCTKTPPESSSPDPTPEVAAEPVPAEIPWFVRHDDNNGIDFVHDSGHIKRYLMPEMVCGGVALFDMDNDGDLDVYLVQNGSLTGEPAQRPGNQLFRNRGDGTFENVTESSGTGDRGYGMGVACGDYDQDGDIDLYITNYGPDVLYQNDGTGHFTDVTEAAGVGHEGWGTGAGFFDYDLDGDLDLYVCQYLFWSVSTEIECYNPRGILDYCAPKNYETPTPDLIYRNNGDGTFTDVSHEARLGTSLGTGLGFVAGDFNNDGWLDVFIANDGMKDHLWINQKDGSFLNDALLAGCAVDQDGIEKAGMGVTIADIDDDGDLDLLVCNIFTESDSLYRNDGGYFTDITSRAGLGAVSRIFTRFGMAWHDFNNDGLLDLFQANGGVASRAKPYGKDAYAEPNLLFRGIAPAKFTEQLPRGGTAEPLYGTSRGAAFGDVDNDGDIDILVFNRDGHASMLINEAPKQGNWIMFRVLNRHGSDALNAIVSMQVGERKVRRDVRAAYSYLASNDPRVHVGLGNTQKVFNVTITWLDGTKESFGDFDANQIVELRRGQGEIPP